MRSKYLANMRLLQGVQTRKNTVFSRFFFITNFLVKLKLLKILYFDDFLTKEFSHFFRQMENFRHPACS